MSRRSPSIFLITMSTAAIRERERAGSFQAIDPGGRNPYELDGGAVVVVAPILPAEAGEQR